MRTERVKALIRREWKLSKKFYLSGFAAIFGIGLVFLLFELSMQFGNLKSLRSDELGAIRVFVWYISLTVTAYGPVAVSVSENGTHKKDIQANWLKYSYTLPVTPNERAAARMILLLCIQAVGFLLSAGWVTFSLKMLGSHFSIYAFLIMLVILDIGLLTLLIQYAFILRARDTKSYSALQTKFTVTMIGAGMFFGMLIARKMKHIAEEVKQDESKYLGFMQKIEEAPEKAILTDWLNLCTFGHAEQIISTAKHLLPLAVPLTVVLYVLLFLVIRRNLKGAWSHDRSAV